jgi:hypothetical protein
MGYYGSAEITFDPAIDNEEQAIDIASALSEHSGYKFDYQININQSKCTFQPKGQGDTKWYRCEQDIVWLSKQYPDHMIILHRLFEDYEEVTLYTKNGEFDYGETIKFTKHPEFYKQFKREQKLTKQIEDTIKE